MKPWSVALILVGSTLLFACPSYAFSKAKVTRAIATSPQSTMAYADIDFGELSQTGSGCLGNSLTSEISSDHLQIKIHFDQFLTQLDDSNRTSERKSCNLTIPIVKLPLGKKLVTLQILAKGNHELASGTTARVGFDSRFSDTPGAHIHRHINADTETTFGSFEVRQVDAVESNCKNPTNETFHVDFAALIKKVHSSYSNHPSNIRLEEVVIVFGLQPCS